MKSNIVKEGKLYTHCKKCTKFLPKESPEGICQKCKVKGFDEKHKQKNTLLKYGKN